MLILLVKCKEVFEPMKIMTDKLINWLKGPGAAFYVVIKLTSTSTAIKLI